MNWLHFLLWVLGIYCMYYLAIILWDAALSGKSPAGRLKSNELTFSETHLPQKLEPGPEVVPVKTKGVAGVGQKLSLEPEIIASGGVSLKNLFSLAREESIVYTRRVSF